MTAGSIPRFQEGEAVRFLGGQGKIQRYKPEAGTWSYWIEMSMGLEPEFGRVGYETTVVLLEADLSHLEGELA